MPRTCILFLLETFLHCTRPGARQENNAKCQMEWLQSKVLSFLPQEGIEAC